MFLHYVLDGEGLLRADKEYAGDGQTVLFARRPFVINAEAEIVQAIKGYCNGRMGSIDFLHTYTTNTSTSTSARLAKQIAMPSPGVT